jgi:hypothetical protein
MSTRELNAAGYSLETIAAEYETDAALAEGALDMDDPYFRAAWRAESVLRDLDYEHARAQEGSTS